MTRKILNYIKSSCIILYAKMTRYSVKFLSLFVAKCFDTFRLYTTDAQYSLKTGSTSLFSIFCCAKIPPSSSVLCYKQYFYI